MYVWRAKLISRKRCLDWYSNIFWRVKRINYSSMKHGQSSFEIVKLDLGSKFNFPMSDFESARFLWFSKYLRIAIFSDFKMYGNNSTSIRDFDKLLFFFIEFCDFYMLPYTRKVRQKNHAKRNDHLLPKMYEPSRFWQFFVMKNSFITAIGNLIFKIFMFVSQLIYKCLLSFLSFNWLKIDFGWFRLILVDFGWFRSILVDSSWFRLILINFGWY